MNGTIYEPSTKKCRMVHGCSGNIVTFKYSEVNLHQNNTELNSIYLTRIWLLYGIIKTIHWFVHIPDSRFIQNVRAIAVGVRLCRWKCFILSTEWGLVSQMNLKIQKRKKAKIIVQSPLGRFYNLFQGGLKAFLTLYIGWTKYWRLSFRFV